MTSDRKALPTGWSFAALARRRAALDGVDLEERIWQVVLKLLDEAEGGDKAAVHILLDRLFGPVQGASTSAVQVNVGTDGVPAKNGERTAKLTPNRVRAYLTKLDDIVSEQGLAASKADGPRIRVVDRTDVDDLL